MTKPLRTCTCCGEAKVGSRFSWDEKKRDYRPHCESCGSWYKLIVSAFSPERNRENHPRYVRKQGETDGNPLFGVWK